MWPILLDGKFFTIIQVDQPVFEEEIELWTISMLDIGGRVQKALYRECFLADRAWEAFRSFAGRYGKSGYFTWPTGNKTVGIMVFEESALDPSLFDMVAKTVVTAPDNVIYTDGAPTHVASVECRKEESK